MWRPITGIFYLLPIIPAYSLRIKMFQLPLGQYMIDFVIAGIFIGLFVRGKLSLPKGALGKLLLAYVIFSYISLFYGAIYLNTTLPIEPHDPRLSFWHDLTRMPMLFFAAYCCVEKRFHIVCILVLICVGLFGVAKSFRSNAVVGKDYSSFSYSVRTGATMGSAGVNGLAALEAQWCMFFGVVALTEKRFWRKAVFVFISAACAYCVLYALSRGAYASVLVAWVYLAIVRRKLYLLIPLVVLLLTWQVIVPGAVRDRVLNTVDQQGDLEDSAAKRIDLWNYTMDLITSTNVVFGTGFNTYFYIRAGEELRDTHNLYLKLVAETGIVGTLLFLSIWWAAYRAASKLYKLSQDPWIRAIGLGVCVSMVCIVIGNFFGDRWFNVQVSGYTFVIFAVVSKSYELLTADPHALDDIQPEIAPVYMPAYTMPVRR